MISKMGKRKIKKRYKGKKKKKKNKDKQLNKLKALVGERVKPYYT